MISGNALTVTERNMTATGAAGVGNALATATIDPGATFVQANGQSVLTFTAARIAGQAITLAGMDNIIAAMGPADNSFNTHASKGTAPLRWIPLPTITGSQTVGGVEIKYQLSTDRSKVTVTATAPGTVWVAVGLGLKMAGGKVVLGMISGNALTVTERNMTAYGAAGVGNALATATIDPGATFVQANGQSVLTFTAASIAGQAINLTGTDNIIAAMGPADNSFGRHASRDTASMTWIPAVTAAPTPAEPPPAYIELKFTLRPDTVATFTFDQAQTENNQVSKKLANLIVADSTKTTLTYVSIQNVRLIPEGDPVPSPLTMSPAFGTIAPSGAPTLNPTFLPTNVPTRSPTFAPTDSMTSRPTLSPTFAPTLTPTFSPADTSRTGVPSVSPTLFPTFFPTSVPTGFPTVAPTDMSTLAPSAAPTLLPTAAPSFVPTTTKAPTYKPTSIFNDTYTLAPFDKKLSAASFSLKLDINLNNIDDQVLKRLITELATKFNVSASRIVIWGMRAGSVIVDGGVLPASSSTEKSALEVASAISTATTWNDGSMSYKVESVPAAAPAEAGSSLGLTIALAVIGVLAVVAIVAVVIVRKRKSHRRSTHHGHGSEMRNVTSHLHHHREEKNTGVC